MVNLFNVHVFQFIRECGLRRTVELIKMFKHHALDSERIIYPVVRVILQTLDVISSPSHGGFHEKIVFKSMVLSHCNLNFCLQRNFSLCLLRETIIFSEVQRECLKGSLDWIKVNWFLRSFIKVWIDQNLFYSKFLNLFLTLSSFWIRTN